MTLEQELRKMVEDWRYWSFVVATNTTAVQTKCADDLSAILDRHFPPQPETNPRHRVEAWEDGPPTNPAHDCGDMA